MDDYKMKNNLIDLTSLDDYINHQKSIYYYDFINEIEALRKKYGYSLKERMELQELEALIIYKRVDCDDDL